MRLFIRRNPTVSEHTRVAAIIGLQGRRTERSCTRSACACHTALLQAAAHPNPQPYQFVARRRGERK